MVQPLQLPYAITAAVIVMFLSVTPLRADDYPCGSDSMSPAMKRLIPQEVGGADFRPACRRHDACYDTPGTNKRDCDRRYLKDMHTACKCSSRPLKCRITACLMYAAVRLGGSSAFDAAQRKAR